MENEDTKDFFDDENVFERYINHRQKVENPNELIEKPIVLELLLEVEGNVLDLGCGYGDIAEQLIQKGVTKYLGIDSSDNMITLGRSRNSDTKIELVNADITSFDFEPSFYDWVIGRLVLHYIEDLEALLDKIHLSLKPEGHFLFSVEHPILTSSIEKSEGKKKDWTVDNYFNLGSRKQTWMGKQVIKYHRTLEEYWRLVNTAGFVVEEIKEGRPRMEMFQSKEEFERRSRIPLFLIVKMRKK